MKKTIKRAQKTGLSFLNLPTLPKIIQLPDNRKLEWKDGKWVSTPR